MALMRSLLSQITDNSGHISKDFRLKSPKEWADEQMMRRYSQSLHPEDHETSFPYACWEHLCDEYLALRQWFDESGKLSPMLQSASLVNRLGGPIGDGIGWDFKSTGEPEMRMLMFKGPLITACRAASTIPAVDRAGNSIQMSGLANIVRGSYTERAEIHRWVGYEKDGLKFNGEQMSRRWVAHMTYTFLINLGANRKWSWEVSKAKAVFGPIEEERNAM